MFTGEKNWLQKPNVSWLWLLVAAGLWTVLLLLFDQSDLVDDLETKVSRPFDFRIRERLGRSPKLHPKIKVFAIDDTTVSWLGRPSPNIIEWGHLILAIAKQKPKFIVIDALFSIADIPKDAEIEAQNIIAELEKVEIPIVVGAFVAPRKVRFRSLLGLDHNRYRLENLVSKGPNIVVGEKRNVLDIPFARSQFVYGPDPRLRKAFPYVGHLMYTGDGEFPLYLRLDAEHILPHFMLLPWSDRKFHHGKYFIDGNEIPTYSDGRIPINFSPFSYFLKHTKSLRRNMVLSNQLLPVEGVSEGDMVYIIPAFYTGNTDFKLTPFGAMPAGFAHLSVLNSIVTQNWLRPIKLKSVIILIMCFLGGYITKRVTPFGLGPALIGGSLLWLCCAILAFSYLGWVVPWLLPISGYTLVGITVFIEKMRIAEKKSQFIKNCLDGVIASEEIRSIAKKPELLNFAAREQVVTIVFIDVVGFSLVAENQLPRRAFNELKSILGQITKIVHKYNGIVNKNLGDGLLCFFGYSIENNVSTPDHAEEAVSCAFEIQSKNLVNTLKKQSEGDPVYPLRIGINTSSVYLGNIGADDRIDLTIVGNGVNFAKRLEGACRNHGVLIGVTTKELIEPISQYHKSMKRKYIKIKHHEGLVEAWDLDPFYLQPDKLARAMVGHQHSLMAIREEERWEAKEHAPIVVSTNIGEGKITNFSKTGLSLVLEVDVMIGTILSLDVFRSHNTPIDPLVKSKLQDIKAEICWCRNVEGAYLYGLRYTELSPEQRVELVKYFMTFSQVLDVKGDWKAG